MRLNYEIKENIFKVCNEYAGIDQFKRTMLKKGKIITYTNFLLGQLILVLFVTILLLIPFYKTHMEIVVDCTILMLFFVFLQAAILCIIYLKFKKGSLNGTLIIDDYGILDETEFTRHGVAWSEIEAVVQSKYAVYILTKRNTIFVYNTEIVKSMIKEMKYHKRGIKLINITKKV